MAKNDIMEARRDNIIDAAMKVFAEKAFSEVNVSDISKEAGVSTPVLYEYFKTKEDMLFAIPEKYTKEPIRLLEGVIPYLRGAEAKIRAIVQGYMTLYEQNPLYSSIVILQLKSNRNFVKTNAYQMIRKVARILLNCIKEGIDDGTFKEDTDPFLIRSMILGSIEHLCTRKLLLGSPSDLVAFADPMIDAILAGIRTQPKQLSMNLSLNNADIIKSLISETLRDAKDTAPKRKKASNK
ncbi:MAG TPA: TetR/AcrR family transcriptional regulator [Smithella sp.]|nr:TetR/AcrR family transcriptional regulator [Smithella sp.]